MITLAQTYVTEEGRLEDIRTKILVWRQLYNQDQVPAKE